MSQSKRHSAMETATNTAVGFVGSYFITFACFHIPAADLAAKTLYATLGCTVWSLLRGYFLRRLFNHLHASQAQPLETLLRESEVTRPSERRCMHLYVCGFGGMGDAVVCCKCGIDKYPEVAPGYKTALALGRVVNEDDHNYEHFREKALAARNKRLMEYT